MTDSQPKSKQFTYLRKHTELSLTCSDSCVKQLNTFQYLHQLLLKVSFGFLQQSLFVLKISYKLCHRQQRN
jgi:hypothetical protein